MLYSVRMRAAQGGPHEQGGMHISGAERLVDRESIITTASLMLERALTHTRGNADFININVETVNSASIATVPVLAVEALDTRNVTAGRAAARDALLAAGVSTTAVTQGMEQLLAPSDSLRGAMLLSAATGQRLDDNADRGIRVSRMDVKNEQQFQCWLKAGSLQGDHVREALVLASKVVSTPGIIAELCWSDDPEYTTGYVATKTTYLRIPHLKPYNSMVGGRIFFIQPEADVSQVIQYLERKPVLVTIPQA